MHPVKKTIQELPPAYFALAMSTGIVSIGAHLVGLDSISEVLFWINNLAYIVLFLLFAARLIGFFPNTVTDLSSPDKGAGFFTVVAGSCVLGIQYVLQKQNTQVAVLLWMFALLTWLVLVYAFFWLVIVKPEKPPFDKGINGSWLLLAVSTQSIAILGTLLVKQLPIPDQLVLLFTLAMFLLGFLFYLILITLILYRLVFLPLTPDQFSASYWIDMGAAAITTLAGATLCQAARTDATFGDFLPFLKGVSLLCWAVGTWWIPLIGLLEGWRIRAGVVSLGYNPQRWSLVFPLGMYTVCTWRLSEALQLPALQHISSVFIYVALAAWGITFLSLCAQLVRPSDAEKG